MTLWTWSNDQKPSQILWPFCEAMLFQNVYTPDKRINMNPTGRRFSQHVSFLRAPSDPEGCISSILSWWSQCPHFNIVVGSRVSGKGSLPSSILKCSLLTRSRHNRHVVYVVTHSTHFTSFHRDPTRELAAKSNLHRDFGTLAWIRLDLSQFDVMKQPLILSIAHSQSSSTAASLKDFFQSLDVRSVLACPDMILIHLNSWYALYIVIFIHCISLQCFMTTHGTCILREASMPCNE